MLTDAQIGKLSIELRQTVRDFFAKKEEARSNDDLTLSERSTSVISDRALSDILLTIHPDSLDEMSPAGYAELPMDDKDSVIERALLSLTKDSGLVFDKEKTNLWIQVSVVHEGRLPLRKAGDYRWIRLSSIDQVIPKVGLGAFTDSRGLGWNLKVRTSGGEEFYASDETYRGNLIHYPQNVLMSAINSAVKAENLPVPLDALPKHA